MIDILIVEDEPLARQRLVQLTQSLGYENVKTAQNAEIAWSLICDSDPAIVLLDIEMPGESGLSLGKRISALECPPAIIFTTAYDEYALTAFETLASGYLLKPIKKDALEKALEKASKLTKPQTLKRDKDSPNTHKKNITIKGHRGVQLIAVDSIRAFIADQKYIRIISTQEESLIDGTLKELEAEWHPVFIRIHRNTLVSSQHIQGLDRDSEGQYHVRLADCDLTPTISRRYVSTVKTFLEKI